MKIIKIAAVLLGMLLFVSSCGKNEEKEIIYVEASDVESTVTTNYFVDGLEFDWMFDRDGMIPYCFIINHSDVSYTTGYAALEVFSDGTWMQAKCLDGTSIPETVFNVPANRISDKIDFFMPAYGNTFPRGRYRAVVKLTEAADEASAEPKSQYVTWNFDLF